MDRIRVNETYLRGGGIPGVGTFLLLVESGVRAPGVDVAVEQCLRHFYGTLVASSGGYTFLAFSRPSEALQAAVQLVGNLKTRVLASVMISEVDPSAGGFDPVEDRLVGAASKAESGQIVVNLAMHELARASLDADFSFDELGSFQIGRDGYQERLLLVQHPDLPNREITVTRGRAVYRTSTFIGRDREITALRRQLDLSRTVTIVGPAGIGKTALIHRLITDVESDFADGTHYIDLGPVARESMLLPNINRLLGVGKLPGEDNLDALVAAFRERRALLVFDSCEHLVSAIRKVIDTLLGECPNMAVLAGSQTSLKTLGEDRYPLNGLEVPSPLEDWHSIREYEAVALFIDRAQLANNQFVFDESISQAVVNICRRLDGIPLAIELAATKTAILSPRQIVDRLDDRFLLLQNRQPNASEKHQTLRATIDWSYGLLDGHDRALLRRLAVFAGTFSVEQAEHVCAYDDDLRPRDVLGAFEKLVDCSFLSNSSVRTTDKRFFLSETMRLYATEKLREAEEEKVLLKRHQAWCKEFAERVNQELLGADQLAWIERMDASYEDVRLVIESGFQKGGDPLLSVDTLISSNRFFILRNYYSEGLRLAEKAIACKGCEASPKFVRVVNLAGVLATYLGDRVRARRYVLQCYTVAMRRGDLEVAASAMVNLAISVQTGGNLKKACRYYNRAARSFRAIRNNQKLFITLANVVGVEADLHLLDQAHAHLDEALSLEDALVDTSTIAKLYQNAGHLCLMEGLPLQTIDYSVKCLPILEKLGDFTAVATTWRTAAHAAAQLGNFQAASVFCGAARKQAASMEGPLKSMDVDMLDDLSQRIIEELGEHLFRSHSLIGSLMNIGQLTQELERLRAN